MSVFARNEQGLRSGEAAQPSAGHRPRNLREAVDAVARIAPEIAARVRNADTAHPQTFSDLKESGLPAFVLPKRFGGGGAGLAEASAVVRSLAEVDASTALVLSMHYIHCTRLVRDPELPAEVADLVSMLAARSGLLNFSASEGRSGAPSRGKAPSTVATEDADGWVLDGTKSYVTGSIGLDVILVTARVLEQGDELGAVKTFIVPADSAGLEVVESWDTLGLRGTASNDIVLNSVRVPRTAILPDYDPNTTPAGGENFYNWWSVLFSSIYVGVATAARKVALAFAAQPRVDGVPGVRGDQEHVRAHAVELELSLLQAQTLLDSVISRVERGTVPGLAPSVKMLAHRHASAAVDAATRVVGGASVWNGSDLPRYFRDLRVAGFNPPNDDVVIGRIGEVLFSDVPGSLLAASAVEGVR